MPRLYYTTMKLDVDSLFISRDAGGTIFVDKAWPGASDSNDGLSATEPKLTIGGAILASGAGWTIRIAPGSYQENVVVPAGYDGLRMIGRARDGPQKTSIAPATGIPLTIGCGYTDMSYLELVDTAPAVGDPHNTCLYATGYGHNFHDLSVRGASAGVWGIWLDDVDYGEVYDCFLEAAYTLNSIGIFVGNDSVGCRIYHNYLHKWGSGAGDPGGPSNGYAIGRHKDAQRSVIEENDLIDNYVGVYFYPPGGPTDIEGDFVGHNNFMENLGYDVYDEHDFPTSANVVDENFYGYVAGTVNWYDDPNGDNIADYIVRCGLTNRDKHPLPGPYTWKNASRTPRVGVV